MIYLLNANSGSSLKSSLVNWSKHRKDIGGFLCVNVMNKLTLRHFSTATYAQFQVPENYTEETTTFDDYAFANTAFDIAKEWMQKDMALGRLKYFFLDEVGQLEIDDMGHDPLVRQIIKQDNPDQIFIFLVREPLLDLVMEKYNFQNKKVINLKQVTG